MARMVAVDQVVAEAEVVVDKCVLFVIMVLEMAALVVVVVAKVAQVEQGGMEQEVRLVFI